MKRSRANTTYLFFGIGSEFVLHSLATQLIIRGHNRIELDVLYSRNTLKVIESLKGRSVVFITSAHLLLDQENFSHFYPSVNVSVLSPLEIMSILKPVRSYFIPHDLTKPIIQYEKDYLSLFSTFFCAREIDLFYNIYTKTVMAGWIKYDRLDSVQLSQSNITWFFSNIQFALDNHLTDFHIHYAEIIKLRPKVKVPSWFNEEKIVSLLKHAGLEVIDSKISSTSLIIASDIIVTNGYSSIIAEAYMLGKKIINVYTEEDTSFELASLSHMYPEVIFVQNKRPINISLAKDANPTNPLSPFNFPLVINTITHL